MKNKIKRFFPFLCCVVLISALIVPAAAAGSTTVDPNAITSFSTVITIDGEQFVFFGDANSSPAVSMAITSTGGLLSSGTQSYTFTYSGSGTFLGFAYSSDASAPTFEVDATLNFPGTSGSNSSYTLFSVASDEEDPDPSPFVRTIKGGVWRVRSDGEGNLLPPSGWSSNFSFFFLNFTSNGIKFQRIHFYDDNYHLNYDGFDVLSYLVYTPSDGWAPPFTTILVEGDQTVSLDAYSWFISVFDYISDDPNPGTYYTAVEIYDYTGRNIVDQFWVSSSPAAPSLSISFRIDGLKILSGDEIVYSVSPDNILVYDGFSDAPYSHLPVWQPGESLTIGGSPENSVLRLYFVFMPEYGDPGDLDLDSFLNNAVGGFLEFEIFPHISLSDIVWLTITIGVFFALLKMFI